MSQINVGKTWNDHIIEICKLVKLNYHKTQWDGQNDQVFRLILIISERNHNLFRLHSDLTEGRCSLKLRVMSQMTEGEKQKIEALLKQCRRQTSEIE